MTLVDLDTPIGIVGYGLYIPSTFHTAADVTAQSGGRWTADAVQQKLGFDRKPVAVNEAMQEALQQFCLSPTLEHL